MAWNKINGILTKQIQEEKEKETNKKEKEKKEQKKLLKIMKLYQLNTSRKSLYNFLAVLSVTWMT